MLSHKDIPAEFYSMYQHVESCSAQGKGLKHRLQRLPCTLQTLRTRTVISQAGQPVGHDGFLLQAGRQLLR